MTIRLALRTALLCSAMLGAVSAHAITLPTPVSPPTVGFNSLKYGDFTVYSLPYLNYLTSSSNYDVSATCGAIKDLVVVGTGVNGGPCTTNTAGMDGAYATPNNSPNAFSTSNVADPGGSGQFNGDTANTWDAQLSALRTYLGGNEFVIFFGFNEGNNSNGGEILNRDQDFLARASVVLKDLDGIAPDLVFTFEGGAFPGTSYAYDSNGDTVDENWGRVHGEICVTDPGAPNKTLIHLGPCVVGDPASAVTINQDLGINQAAFALYNKSLTDEILNAGSLYDVIQADLNFLDISSGYEQIFLDNRIQRIPPPPPIPEPASIAVLGAGVVGLGIAARRRKAKA